jgi:hypothetical protein
MWRKPWTVPKASYFKYLNSLMMYSDYDEVFGFIKELELFARFENEMFNYLAKDPELLEAVLVIHKKSLLPLSFRLGFPFLTSKFVFASMTKSRKFLNILKFYTQKS